MKKYLVMLMVILVFSVNFCSVGNCLSDKVKNSIYLQLKQDGKIAKKIKDKIEEFGYEFDCGDWYNKVIVGNQCIDVKPDVTPCEACEVDKILNKMRKFNLVIPVKDTDKEDNMGSGKAVFVVTLNKPADNAEIADILSSGKTFKIKFLNVVFGRSYEQEVLKMGEPCGVVGRSDDVKIMPLSMGTYTWGYVLTGGNISTTDKAWFWCSHQVDEYEEGKFHSLGKVLNSYWEYLEDVPDFEASRQ